MSMSAMKRFVPYVRGIPDDDHRDIIVIHTGLSVIVCGHLVDIRRDDQRKIATVQVSVIPGYKVTGLEQSILQGTADQLAQRAQRFLGMGWKIVPWVSPQEKVAGVSA